MKLKILVLFLFISYEYTFSQNGWSITDSSFNCSFKSISFINTNTGWICGTSGALIKTTNCGITWLDISIPTIYDLYNVWFANDMTGYIGGQFGMLIKTTNGGVNWIQQLQNIENTVNRMFFLNSETGFATGYNFLIRTTNGGINWENAMGNFYFTGGALYFINKDTGLAYTNSSICRTTNGGTNWVTIFYKLGINYIKFFDEYTGYATRSSLSVYKTTNSGVTWDTLNSNNYTGVNYSLFLDLNTGYSYYAKIRKTTDSGLNWYTQYNVPSNRSISSLIFVNANTGFAAGEYGRIYKTTDAGGPIGIKPISNNTADKFMLYQNYPNPFNPNTKIRFDIPSFYKADMQSGSIKLIIYNSLGQEVITLVNESSVSGLYPGTYEVEFKANDYPSGVYYYQLKDWYKLIDTKKMVLIK